MTVYNAKKIIQESAPLLVFLLLIEILIGQLLNAQKSLVTIPLILALIPVINGVGGNIGGVLGARLASGLHTGVIDPGLKGKELRKNIAGAFILGIIAFTVLAILIYIILPIVGIDADVIGLEKIFLIMIGSGLLLTIIVIGLSILTAFYSFKRGLDPDNYVIPIVTTSGDVLGISALIFIVYLIGI
ncbi:MAG: magnesium transporter [Thermoplasmata archaeon]|nr:magnesium transporter [Thermoplasmata archaeon]